MALRIQEIEEASARDVELQVVHECLHIGNWERAPKAYMMARNELASIGHVGLRGTRIVIPRELQQRVLELAHEGHQGIVKTKERLRSKVWWPGMDKQAEKKCKQCYGCQLTTKHVPPPPVKPTTMPEEAWQELALDLLGPLPGGEYLLVLVDYFSRWMEVNVVRSTTSAMLIKCLDNHFARYGVPVGLRTDNGPNLISQEMESYLREMGIKHQLTTPLWPRANGEVERQNRSLLKSMRAFQAEGKDWRAELNKFLLAYRSTNHTTTGVSPAELFLKRKLSTKLPELTDVKEKETGVTYQQVRDRDAERKQLAKDYADVRRQAADRDIKVGDVVLLEKRKENKLSSSYESEPYEVTARHGDQVLVKSPQGVEYRRNMQHVKQFLTAGGGREPELQLPTDQISPCGLNAVPPPQPETPPAGQGLPSESVVSPQQQQLPTEAPCPGTPRRSGRVSQPPRCLADYVLY